MSRRIDVELTSRRDDGTWTWRAAGAKAPKGVVEGGVLPGESKVGDVLRVEIDSFLDGISIVAVLPAKSARTEPQRIELLERGPDQLVTTTLAPKGRGGDRRPRRDGDDSRGDRNRGDRGDRGDRPRRSGAPGENSGGGDRRPARSAPEPKARPKRLRPLRTHRHEVLASLPDEQRPIGEELMRGGVPGVRAALDHQNELARAEGKPEINPEPLMALAEELWPRMRTAEWRDRAEAALGDVEELDLRDLRSVVVAADNGARDDETREMATQLREALNRRVDEEHTKWLTELAELVSEGRVVAALRRSSRPPKAGSPLPPDLARLLVDKTNEALNGEVGVDRWSVLLDALSYSPVRSSVDPADVPDPPSDELVAVVRKVASRLPNIAARFGIEAAPAAAPTRGARRTRSRPDRGGGDQARRGPSGSGESSPIPPPPPLTPASDADGGTAPEALPDDAVATNAADAAVAAPAGPSDEATGSPPTDQPVEEQQVDEQPAKEQPVDAEPVVGSSDAAPSEEQAQPAEPAADNPSDDASSAAGEDPIEPARDDEPANAEA